MATPTVTLLSQLAANRRAIDKLYEQTVALGADGQPIPCAAIDVYNVLAARQIRAETAVIAQAQAAGIAVPEGAPRPFALFGACTPGLESSPLSEESRRAALRRMAQERKRAGLLAGNLTQLVGANAIAQQVRSEHSEAPLDALFAIGGLPWAADAAQALAALQLEPGGAEAPAIGRQLGEAGRNTGVLLEARGLGAADGGGKKRPWWLWPALGAGVVAVGGAAWLALRGGRDGGMPPVYYQPRFAAPDEEGEAMFDPGDGDPDGDQHRIEVAARPRRPRRRRRNRSGGGQQLPRPGAGDEDDGR